MSNDEKRQRFTLAIFLATIIFAIQFLAIIFSGVIIFLLVEKNVLVIGLEHRLNYKYLLIYMGLVSLIIGAIGAAVSSKVTLRPINRIISKLNQLSKGKFETRLSFGYPANQLPAFISLSKSFNTLAEELECTELLRSDFINNFSHEFKTPIVSIAGFTKLLKRGNLTEQQKLEYLDIIEEEALRLSYMATNVLNLTKVENQAILTDVTQFNLSEQIRSCVLLLEHQWDKKNIEFNLEFKEYMITANEELLKQVWINLLDNAIKFSPEAGMILLKIDEAEESFLVTIANEGCEIPANKLDKIFNKFYQVDESHASKGNGVGLAIVKRIVELHKGNIDVESKNGVTVFHVEIPQ